MCVQTFISKVAAFNFSNILYTSPYLYSPSIFCNYMLILGQAMHEGIRYWLLTPWHWVQS